MTGYWIGISKIIFSLTLWSLGDENNSNHHILIQKYSNQEGTQENKSLDFVKVKICTVPRDESDLSLLGNFMEEKCFLEHSVYFFLNFFSQTELYHISPTSSFIGKGKLDCNN